MQQQWLWKMRWGDAVLACGAGELPFELRAAARPLKGDRAHVQWGTLTYELESRPAPERAFVWGVPDFPFGKVLVICLMAFGALVMVLRERIAQLERERMQQLALRPQALAPALPRLTRWDDRAAWRHGATTHALAAADLARIRRFPQKVEALGRAEAQGRQMVAMLERSDNLVDFYGTSVLGARSTGAVVGGLIGKRPVDVDSGLGAGGIGLGSRTRHPPQVQAMGMLKMLDSTATGKLSALDSTQALDDGFVEGGTVGGVIGGVSQDVNSPKTQLTLTRVDDDDLTLLDGVPSNTFATRLLRGSTGDVRQCLSGDFTGALDVSLNVSPDGTVSTAHVTGVSGPASDCVRRIVEHFHFRHSQTAQTVTARWNAG